MTTRLNQVANLAAGDGLPESYVDNVTNDVNYLVIAGADLVSGATLNPTAEFHKVTGATTIDNITDSLGAVAGQQVRLWFQSALTIRNNGGGTGNIRTLSGLDRSVRANEILTLTYDGANWRDHAPRSGYELICELLLTGTQASFDTNTILGGVLPTYFRNLVVEISGRCDTGATDTQSIGIRFNNDSGNNYDDQFMQGNAATVTAQESLAAAQGRIGNLPAATASAGIGSAARINIFDYTGTTFQKSYLSANAFKRSTASGNTFSTQFAGAWRNTAAITRIQVISIAGNFIAGTRFSLYGSA